MISQKKKKFEQTMYQQRTNIMYNKEMSFIVEQNRDFTKIQSKKLLFQQLFLSSRDLVGADSAKQILPEMSNTSFLDQPETSLNGGGEEFKHHYVAKVGKACYSAVVFLFFNL